MPEIPCTREHKRNVTRKQYFKALEKIRQDLYALHNDVHALMDDVNDGSITQEWHTLHGVAKGVSASLDVMELEYQPRERLFKRKAVNGQ